MVAACAWLSSRAMAPHAVFAQRDVRDAKSSAILARQDLIRILDCATRPDQLLAVKPESYGKENFTLRYLYPVAPGREANVLNTFQPAHWVAVALYHSDGHSAALLEVGFDGPERTRTITLLDGANLEEKSGQWEIKNILNGVASTWAEMAQHVRRLSGLQVATVARTDVTRTNAACEFPPRGLEFVGASPTRDRSPWKFKDGLVDGIQFKQEFGPFKNIDLKRMPFDTVFMISYGPS